MEIKIPVLDTLAEAAKGFIQKVITPPLEEVGLMAADTVRLWRFKNQIRVVTKTEEYLKSKNIKTKKVSLKVMAPLLEGAAMEEEESLQEKWAALLANTVSENSQIHTVIYSFILSQITKEEAEFFDFIFKHSTDTQSNNGITFTIKKNTIFNIQNLRTINENSDVILDNLIRLGIVKISQASTMNQERITLTDLGFHFMGACKFH